MGQLKFEYEYVAEIEVLKSKLANAERKLQEALKELHELRRSK